MQGPIFAATVSWQISLVNYFKQPPQNPACSRGVVDISEMPESFSIRAKQYALLCVTFD